MHAFANTSYNKSMRRTIRLSEQSEHVLRELANKAGIAEDRLLDLLADRLLQGELSVQPHDDRIVFVVSYGDKMLLIPAKQSEAVEPIRSMPGVMGGDACIRNTRIPVWLLVEYKRQGLSDGELLQAYPTLNASDLIAAWDYFAAHNEEIERQAREHQEAA